MNREPPEPHFYEPKLPKPNRGLPDIYLAAHSGAVAFETLRHSPRGQQHREQLHADFFFFAEGDVTEI